jgi:hypothetical protein
VWLRCNFEESFVEFRFAVIVECSERLLHHHFPNPALSTEVRSISNSHYALMCHSNTMHIETENSINMTHLNFVFCTYDIKHNNSLKATNKSNSQVIHVLYAILMCSVPYLRQALTLWHQNYMHVLMRRMTNLNGHSIRAELLMTLSIWASHCTLRIYNAACQMVNYCFDIKGKTQIQ